MDRSQILLLMLLGLAVGVLLGSMWTQATAKRVRAAEEARTCSDAVFDTAHWNAGSVSKCWHEAHEMTIDGTLVVCRCTGPTR